MPLFSQTGGLFIETILITNDIMRIDTKTQIIDIQQIDNRRFMYNPKIGMLVLGQQYAEIGVVNGSHATELATAGFSTDFDDFVRGWIGVGGDYPKGVIHFAPCVDERNIMLFDRAFDTLEMFAENGALAGTVIRGFGNRWEQPMFDILTPRRETQQKSSARKQLKTGSAKDCGKHPKNKQYEL